MPAISESQIAFNQAKHFLDQAVERMQFACNAEGWDEMNRNFITDALDLEMKIRAFTKHWFRGR